MFTGIVEEIGVIERVTKGAQSAALSIAAKLIFDDLQLGDSVAVNGVCLTVSQLAKNSFNADVMHETLRRSSLGSLGSGSRVNLERALRADGRLGGHIVSGHIDGLGTITGIRRDDNALWYTVKAPQQIIKYVVQKGSIAIDGVSLTVAELSRDTFSVSLIPHTAGHTIMAEKAVGDRVNLENDIISKYVEKLLNSADAPAPPKGLTREHLLELGY